MENSTNQRASLGLVFLMAGLTSIGPFAIDTYLPAFLDIARDLNSNLVEVQITMSAYLIAFALMTLWHGAISDCLGRRRVILYGVGVFFLATVACSLARNIEQLIIFRSVQGLSAGAGIIVSRAMIRDLYDGVAAQKLMSHVSMIFSVSPAIAPIVGGQLQVCFGWRSIFYFLVLFTLILWLTCYKFLPESHPLEKRSNFNFTELMQAYREVLSHRSFIKVALTISISFGGFFIYVLSAPMFLIKHLQLAENQFYWLFIPATSGMMIGAWLSGKMAGKFSRNLSLKIAFALMLTAAIGNVLINYFLPVGIPQSIIFIPIYTIGVTLAHPILMLMSLDPFASRRGMAASCQGFIHLSLTALVAGIVAPHIWHRPENFAWWMLGSSLLSLAIISSLPSSRLLPVAAVEN